MSLGVEHSNRITLLDKIWWNIGVPWICYHGGIVCFNREVHFNLARMQFVQVEINPDGPSLPVLHFEAETAYALYLFDFAKEAQVADGGRTVLICICK